MLSGVTMGLQTMAESVGTFGVEDERENGDASMVDDLPSRWWLNSAVVARRRGLLVVAPGVGDDVLRSCGGDGVGSSAVMAGVVVVGWCCSLFCGTGSMAN
ncbi:uncharacterized protein HKW66_Vig0245790 [Vigna angularis]|uniref:Uncharacterized protein n=1 Tax=Phaseolus angularis TaxID=3914 RepID=A0A8T0KFZ5_PHAAN|nr:uncharacterized protein HKW66_Vig0245790 [Vigna angularis]